MKNTSALLLALVAACGGASQSETAPAAPAASVTAAATATAAASAPPAEAPPASTHAADEAPADPPADATTGSGDDEKIDPLAAPAAKLKLVDKPLAKMPFSVSVPAIAVITAEGDDKAVVSPEGGKGYGMMTIGPRFVLFEPLDKELESLKKDKLEVVSKRGSGSEYTIVYKPYPNMYTYQRFFTLGGKDLWCLVEGLYHRSEIPVFDAICKSMRAKKK